MSLHRVPVVVINKLDRIQNLFIFLELNHERTKMDLMRWSKLLKPKEEGGFVLGNL